MTFGDFCGPYAVVNKKTDFFIFMQLYRSREVGNAQAVFTASSCFMVPPSKMDVLCEKTHFILGIKVMVDNEICSSLLLCCLWVMNLKCISPAVKRSVQKHFLVQYSS